MVIKSERLKKLEKELEDLEKWLKLGLVPPIEEKKHRLEMESIKKKINDEHQRLQHILQGPLAKREQRLLHLMSLRRCAR